MCNSCNIEEFVLENTRCINIILCEIVMSFSPIQYRIPVPVAIPVL